MWQKGKHYGLITLVEVTNPIVLDKQLSKQGCMVLNLTAKGGCMALNPTADH